MQIFIVIFNFLMQAEIDVIVVGAGIAGMAAAAELAKSGRHVLVLEANDYIGGRLKTRPIPLSNNTVFPFEEGANWIHGFNNIHPIAKLSKEIEAVKLVETDDDSVISFDEESNNVDDYVNNQKDAYLQLREKMQDFQNISIFEAFQRLNESKLNNKYFMHRVSKDIEFQTSTTIRKLSAEHGYQDPIYKGKEMLVISGYQDFAIHLSKDQKIKVLLNHKVAQIFFDGSRTTIKCQNSESFTAKKVICAFPIGVLKSKGIKFVPQLPTWKEQAIEKLNFGNVCKILIILKNKLIERKETYIGVIPNDIQKRGSATYYLNIYALTGLPVIMTFGLGPGANQLEEMPQKDLKDLIASRLRVFADPSFNAEDFYIMRSTWKSDPNFQGGYTSAGVETEPHHWMHMSKPIFERNWHFCGEHTNQNHRATIHGAYDSGINVAKEIINDVGQANWKYNLKLVVQQ